MSPAIEDFLFMVQSLAGLMFMNATQTFPEYPSKAKHYSWLLAFTSDLKKPKPPVLMKPTL